MSSWAIFFCVLVAIPTQLQAQDIVTKACATALDKASCLSVLSSAPNKTDKKSVCTFGLNLVTSTVNDIKKQLTASKDPAVAQAIEDCKKSYDIAMDFIKQAQKGAALEKYPDVNIKMSAALSTGNGCENKFEGARSPVTSLNTKYTKLCSAILAVTNA